MTHEATIINGEIVPFHKGLYDVNLNKLEGKKVTVTIKRKKAENPTDAQRRYYFSVIVNTLIYCFFLENADDLNKDQAHLYLKMHCNFKEKVNKHGEIMRIPLSTSNQNFDVIDKMEYIDRCIRFLESWYSIEVPPPDPKWREKQTRIPISENEYELN